MTVYTIVVKGELSDLFSGAFAGMSLHAGHGETELVGEIADQAQLQGVLSRCADLGLELVRVGRSEPSASARPDPGARSQEGER